MAEEKQTDNKKETREKSALYPFFDMKESIEFTKIVDRIAGKGIAAEESVASELGISKSTKSFAYKVSSARQFGLISKTKEGLQVTVRARSILHPVDENAVPEVVKELFKLPPLYKKLIKQYEGLNLPKPESIANLMYTQFGIAGQVKEKAAKSFMDSAIFVKVVDAEGRLVTSEESKYPDEIPNNIKQKLKNEETEIYSDLQDIKDAKQGFYQTVRMALTGNRDAKLIIPRDITSKDVERIKKLIELLIVEE